MNHQMKSQNEMDFLCLCFAFFLPCFFCLTLSFMHIMVFLLFSPLSSYFVSSSTFSSLPLLLQPLRSWPPCPPRSRTEAPAAAVAGCPTSPRANRPRSACPRRPPAPRPPTASSARQASCQPPRPSRCPWARPRPPTTPSSPRRPRTPARSPSRGPRPSLGRGPACPRHSPPPCPAACPRERPRHRTRACWTACPLERACPQVNTTSVALAVVVVPVAVVHRLCLCLCLCQFQFQCPCLVWGPHVPHSNSPSHPPTQRMDSEEGGVGGGSS